MTQWRCDAMITRLLHYSLRPLVIPPEAGISGTRNFLSSFMYK